MFYFHHINRKLPALSLTSQLLTGSGTHSTNTSSSSVNPNEWGVLRCWRIQPCSQLSDAHENVQSCFRTRISVQKRSIASPNVVSMPMSCSWPGPSSARNLIMRFSAVLYSNCIYTHVFIYYVTVSPPVVSKSHVFISLCEKLIQ